MNPVVEFAVTENQSIVADVVDASSVALLCIDAFTCPDMNPVFDVFQELDQIMFTLAFRTAVDFANFAAGSCKLSLPSDSTSSILLRPVCPCNAQNPVCSPEVSSEVRQVLAALEHFKDSYYAFEVEFLDELDVVLANVDWSSGFVSACLCEYQCMFEHFASSSFPSVIELHPV